MGFDLKAFITGIGFSDVVDIIILSILFYYALKFVSTSKAAQLAKGVLFLIAAYFIAELCNFYAVHWLLGIVLKDGLIAFLIIFQPEIRRALEYIGRGRFAKGFSVNREKASRLVEKIVSSVGYFAARKEGALIIIERGTALSDIADTGTMIDADLSEELLENIFYKGSPLHDGAAIIRRDRILAAGCVLPLTDNSNLSKDLGTRHRAGIGISENSDAIVLIVSEETGIISVAQDGRLSRFLDLKTVEKMLLDYYLNQFDDNSTAGSFMNSIRGKGKENGGKQKNN